MGSLSVNLCGIELDNPIIPASGTFGFGYEFAELYDINELGTFSFKGTTKDPRFGNPTPRIAECPNGMINAVGLQNPGVEKVIAEELPKLKKCFHKPVMANVSGFSVEDYAYTCQKLDKEEQVGWLEALFQLGQFFRDDLLHAGILQADGIDHAGGTFRDTGGGVAEAGILGGTLEREGAQLVDIIQLCKLISEAEGAGGGDDGVIQLDAAQIHI